MHQRLQPFLTHLLFSTPLKEKEGTFCFSYIKSVLHVLYCLALALSAAMLCCPVHSPPMRQPVAVARGFMLLYVAFPEAYPHVLPDFHRC